MAEILEKMVAADVIVMATPVYFYSISARLKTLLERTFPRYHELVNKEFYFIFAAEDSNELSRTRPRQILEDYLYCLEGAKVRDSLLYVGIPQKGSARGTWAMERAYEMGREV